MQNDYMVRLSDQRGATKAELKFITDAWLQTIECRRVLKWTYAYGYYLPEDGEKKAKKKKKRGSLSTGKMRQSLIWKGFIIV